MAQVRQKQHQAHSDDAKEEKGVSAKRSVDESGDEPDSAKRKRSKAKIGND